MFYHSEALGEEPQGLSAQQQRQWLRFLELLKVPKIKGSIKFFYTEAGFALAKPFLDTISDMIMDSNEREGEVETRVQKLSSLPGPEVYRDKYQVAVRA